MHKNTVSCPSFQKKRTKSLQVSNKAVPLQPQLEQESGRLAQLVQSVCLTSRGSAVRIRQRPLVFLFHSADFIGRLAQLVQSVCLTSRGSAVRIRQRPPQVFGRLAQLVQSVCQRLPYKQRVGGSNPSTPTPKIKLSYFPFRAFSSAGSERLPYKQRVGGSNPSTPTERRTGPLKAVLFFVSGANRRTTVLEE